jgi:hypothetical protein
VDSSDAEAAIGLKAVVEDTMIISAIGGMYSLALKPRLESGPARVRRSSVRLPTTGRRPAVDRFKLQRHTATPFVIGSRNRGKMLLTRLSR